MSQLQKLNGFARIFVARPILAFVINLIIVIAGIAALMGVEVREMPEIDNPTLSVRTSYDGASADVVDKQVTEVLEDALGQLDGLKGISSTSSYGSSRITLDLETDTDVDIAANETREIVSQSSRQLPDNIDDPVIRKSDADADPIIRLSLSGDRNLSELTTLAEGRITDRLTLITGIAEVEITGEQANEFRVTISMPALLSRGLSLEDVQSTLKKLRTDYALGSVETNKSSVSLRSIDPTVTSEIIGNLRVNDTTRLSDIALVQYTGEEKSAFSRVDGRTSIGINIIRQSVGNTLTISQDVRAAVAELQNQLPSDVQLKITSDDGVFIEGSINEVTKSILMAIGIVIVVIFLFIRSWRATLIPAIAIPIALTGTIASIWLVGFSINTISLLALVLATGMVVDDAIVETENIVRCRHEGEGARTAAVAGTNEVFFAVISTTATLAAVFIPISFLPGQAGNVFSEFGFVLAFCVTLSTIVALTLAPMLASIFDPGRNGKRKVKLDENGEEIKPKPFFLSRFYFMLVDKAIRYPLIVLGIAIGFAIFALGASQTMTSTLTPKEDRGSFFIMASGPSGSSVGYMDGQIELVEDIIEPYKDKGEIATVQCMVGMGSSTRAFVIVRLTDWNARDRSQEEIVNEINEKLTMVPGLRVMANSPNSLGIRGGGSGLRFAVTGENYPVLVQGADALLAAMDDDPAFSNAQLSSQSTAPQIDVDIDRDRALELGISPATIADAIIASTTGIDAAEVYINGEETEIRLIPDGQEVNDSSGLESIFARTNDGSIIPLSSVTSFDQKLNQSSYAREGGQLAISIRANLTDGTSLGEAISKIRELGRNVLPDGASITLTGEAKELTNGTNQTAIVFAVAGLIVFLVLAAQFESFVSSIIIMLTVPFGLAASMLAITITGGTLNYYSMIGLVMLIGVMAKNGILIVEFANQLRERGQDIDSAIRDAVQLRLRPVMMTMISTVFGGVPLIITSGAGAEARIAVGWVVVGGLGFATFFTLFLTPVFYRWIAPLGNVPGASERKLNRELSKGPESEPETIAIATE